MYHERLMYPHPSRLGEGEAQQPLPEVINADEIRHALSGTEDMPLYGTLVFDAATQISLAVHKAIMTRTGVREPFTPDNLARTQAVNCHGHSVVASECLEDAGLPHLIGVANGHSFVVATDTKRFAAMTDAQSPRLNGDMKNALSSEFFRSGSEQIARHGRAVVYFSSEHYVLRSIRLKEPFDNVSQTHPWLTPKPGRLDQRTYEDFPTSRRLILQMMLYPPIPGREMLANYMNFTYYSGAGDIDAALDSLLRMRAMFPEVDPKSGELKPARALAVELAKRSRPADSASAIEAVASGFNRDQVPSLMAQLWKPDSLRIAGTVSGNTDLLEQAIDSYEAIVPNKQLTLAKLAKAKRVRNDFLRRVT